MCSTCSPVVISLRRQIEHNRAGDASNGVHENGQKGPVVHKGIGDMVHGRRELPVRFNFLRLNVLYTILLGVLAVWVRHEVRPMPLKLLLLGGLILLAAPGDWGTSGVPRPWQKWQ